MCPRWGLVPVVLVVAAALAACDRPASSGPAVTRAPLPSGGAAVTGSLRPDGCVAGPATVTWTLDRPPVDQICAPAGTEIVLSMRPVEGSRWQQVTSSDPTVVSIGPLGFDQEGNTYVTVTAVRAGSAAVTAVASRRRWVLTVRVVA